MDDPEPIAAVEDVPTDGTLLATVTDGEDRLEVVLTRLDDGSVVAWENHCQHWIDTRLDRGDGALVRDGEIVCQKHGATFERDSGLCNWGPCLGAYLDQFHVAIDEEAVYPAERGWRFDRLGPSPDRESGRSGGIGF